MRNLPMRNLLLTLLLACALMAPTVYAGGGHHKPTPTPTPAPAPAPTPDGTSATRHNYLWIPVLIVAGVQCYREWEKCNPFHKAAPPAQAGSIVPPTANPAQYGLSTEVTIK